VKEAIHPKFRRRRALCVRRDVEDHSTKPELHLEICANCHPFFTGKQ
jgi:large subunit ribosomal protein L31